MDKLMDTFNLAVKKHQEGKTDIAQELYNQVLKIDPLYARAHSNLGVIFKELGENQKAKGYFEKAIEIDPNYINAYYNLGVVFKELGENQKARDCYEKAIEINPNYTDVLYNLGVVFKELGENQKAKDCYEKAIKIDPNYIAAFYNLGVIFFELKKYEEAKNCYEKVIKIDPNYMTAHNNLGSVFKELGENQKAKDCYKKALDLKPNSQVALINRGTILFDTGEFELSLIDFDNCNTFDSRSRALTSLYALGRIDEIYRRIEKNSQLDEKNIKIAAFSSFIANKEKKGTAQNFCLNPIDFIHHSNLSSHLRNFNSYITEVIKELHNVNTIWEPFGKSTIGGFQSNPNLFVKPQKKIQNLKSIIITEIESYYLKFKMKLVHS
jgi:tetratricopeptide (TPR) repeat protein